MTYLITQIVFSLVLAGVLGGVIGWLINGYRAYSRQQKSHSELMRHASLLRQADTDNKIIGEDFRELKQRSEETITLLREESIQIPELKKNLEKSQTLVRQMLQKHDAEIRQLTSENSSINNKVRELENREKAVTRLQMDLNTERLKMRSDSTTRPTSKSPANTAAPTNDSSISSERQNAGDLKSIDPKSIDPKSIVPKSIVPKSIDPKSINTKSLEPESFNLESQNPESLTNDTHPGLTEQTEIPLSSEAVTRSNHETSSLHGDTDNSFDDILEKADGVLTRFRNDPSIELDDFQLELDQELDAIRHDLSTEPDLLVNLPESTARASSAPGSATPSGDTTQFAESNSSSIPVLHKSDNEQTVEADPSTNTFIPFHQVFGTDFTPPTHHDDLQHIFGIGPVTERTLNSIGINSYEQLALFNREHIEYVAEVLQIFPGRIERDNWVGSASKIVADRQSQRDGSPDQPQDAHEKTVLNSLEDA